MGTKLLLGISKGLSKASEAVEEDLLRLFKGSCDFCGVHLTKELRHTHEHNCQYFSSCSLCFYYEYQDKIPHQKKGFYVNWYGLSQEELNIMLGFIWSMQYNAQNMEITPEYEEHLITAKELMMDLKYKSEAVKAHFLDGEPTNIPSVTPEIAANYLNLIDEDSYQQRHKMFSQFLWLPPKEIFSQEVAFWAKNSYHMVSGNMKEMMSSAVKKYNLSVS
ncbi:MAG: hypothetical protein HAW67_04165 [Endozoicomonadaceae bacterium]|nr:hypothetical protein [Endozoicomonadaceae bacterium]